MEKDTQKRKPGRQPSGKWTPEFTKEYKRQYYLDNREVRLEANKRSNKVNRVAIVERARLRRLENPEAHRAAKSLRRARKRHVAGSHTADELKAKFAEQGGLCANVSCRSVLEKSGKGKFHWDHIVPLSRGGSNRIDNMQAMCPACNMAKGCMHPERWSQETGTPWVPPEESEPMHATNNERIYTESIGCKVTPELKSEAQAAAEAEGMKVGEWVRRVVTKELRGDASTRVLLAELLKFETVFLTLHMETLREKLLPRVVQGAQGALTLAPGDLTDEDLTQLVARADKVKFAKADRAIVEGRQG